MLIKATIYLAARQLFDWVKEPSLGHSLGRAEHFVLHVLFSLNGYYFLLRCKDTKIFEI